MYYTYLLDQSVLRLRFITVFILAVSVIIVYGEIILSNTYNGKSNNTIVKM